MVDFAKFMKVNGLKRKDIASFLGVSGSFITQITSGDRSLPQEKLALIKANAYGWDLSMLAPTESPVCEPKAEALVDYLQKKVEDQDVLIRELYQQIGMLEAKLDLLNKGGIVEHVVPSSCANVG